MQRVKECFRIIEANKEFQFTIDYIKTLKNIEKRKEDLKRQTCQKESDQSGRVKCNRIAVLDFTILD